MKKAIIEFADGTAKEVKCSDEVYNFAIKIMKQGEQGFGFYKPIRKKRKFVAMTNKEYVKKHNPEFIFELATGGVCACPHHYCLEIQICDQYKIAEEYKCSECWQRLPAKRNGRYILKEVKK
jgi:hypothetical protein